MKKFYITVGNNTIGQVVGYIEAESYDDGVSKLGLALGMDSRSRVLNSSYMQPYVELYDAEVIPQLISKGWPFNIAFDQLVEVAISSHDQLVEIAWNTFPAGRGR